MKKLKLQLNNQNLPKGWRKVRLGEIVEKVIDNRGKNPQFSGIKTEYKLIDTFHLNNERRYPNFHDETKQRYVDEKTYKNWFRSGHPRYGDILMSTVGSGIPQWNLFPKDGKYCIAQNLIGLRIDEKKANFEFIFYYFRQQAFLKMVKGIIIGGAQPSIKVPHFLDLEIFIPQDISEQKRIAEILSAFDEKIELNNKINKTLEEMAQAIFKEWFGENSKFKNKNAKLWKEGYLGDGICSEIIKPGIKKFKKEKIYLATADVNRSEIVNENTKITYENRPIRANMEPVLNSIWFAKMINTYKVLFFFEGNKDDLDKYILSTGFMGIKALRDMEYYLYLYINSERFHKIKDTLVQGAVQEAITNENVKKIKILIPPQNLINNFNDKVKPLIIKIFNNKKENQTLSTLRDLLLPKLMSGEIRA